MYSKNFLSLFPGKWGRSLPYQNLHMTTYFVEDSVEKQDPSLIMEEIILLCSVNLNW